MAAKLVKSLQVLSSTTLLLSTCTVHIQFAYCYGYQNLFTSTLLSLSQIGKSCFDQAEGRLPAAVDGEAQWQKMTSIPSYSRTRVYKQNISYKSQEEKRKREKKI